MITDEINIILENQNIDGVLSALERLKDKATVDHILELVAAIQSPQSNFWTRELLSEPLCLLGGSKYMEILLDAAQLRLDDGHDNDGFHFNLIEMVETAPIKCSTKLKELIARDNFRHHEAAIWLLEFCDTAKT